MVQEGSLLFQRASIGDPHSSLPRFVALPRRPPTACVCVIENPKKIEASLCAGLSIGNPKPLKGPEREHSVSIYGKHSLRQDTGKNGLEKQSSGPEVESGAEKSGVAGRVGHLLLQ